MSLLPYNPSSLGIGGKNLTIAKAGATGLPDAAAVNGANTGDLITFSSAHNLRTGDQLTVTVGTMTGPSTGTFYAIVASATTIKIASSRANAVAGTAVEITGDGTATITYIGASYRAMNWSPARTPKEINRDDEVGNDGEWAMLAGAVRQSGLQLQLATSSTPVPRSGMEFADPDDATRTYVVMDVSPRRESGSIHYCEISYRSTGNQDD